MNLRIIFSILSVAFATMLITACNQQKIVLEKVRTLPDFMYVSTHFGFDLKSMEERNDFILIRGVIDTTTEVPPIHSAVIVINKQEQFLNQTKSVANGKDILEEYSGNGYHLSLNYHKSPNHLFTVYEGKVLISKGASSTEYTIVGVDGYH